MSYSRNGLTLYLRPMAEIPAYQVNNCAKWLVSMGQFKNFLEAKIWLISQEQNAPWNFRAIMSEYFDVNDYQSDFKSKRDVNKYRSTKSNYYGDEAHMWFSAGDTTKQINEQLESGIREWPAKNKIDTYRYPPQRHNPKLAPMVMLTKPPHDVYMDFNKSMGYITLKK